MDDPNDDWDVEAELRRQLDALETPTEGEQTPPCFPPEDCVPGANVKANGFVNPSALFDGPSEPCAVDQQPSKDGDFNFESSFLRLEALLKDRERKLDAFHLTLGEVLKETARPAEEKLEEQSSPEAAPSSQLPNSSHPIASHNELSTKHVKVESRPEYAFASHPKIAVSLSQDSVLPTPPTHKVDCGPEVKATSCDEGSSQITPSSNLSGPQQPAFSEGVCNAEAFPPSQSGPSATGILAQPLPGQVHANFVGNSPSPDARQMSQASLDLEADKAGSAMHSNQKWGATRRALQGAELEIGELQKVGEVQEESPVAPARDLRSEILDLEYQVQLDSLQHHHDRMTSAIELARREELARQADEAAREQARRAAAEAAMWKKEEEQRRRQEERERRLQAIQAQLERAAREAFAAKRIVRAYRAHQTRVRKCAAVRIQAAVRGCLARRKYVQLCREHVIELLKRCEARNDVRGLEHASARGRPLGLGDEADAAGRRTRSRVEEARAAMTSAAAGGSRDEFERAREWAVSARVAQAEITAAEAVFGERVSAKLADIEGGVRVGLPLVNFQTLMRDAHSLGVHKGRLDQFERDVVTRDLAAVRDLQEAARSGSFKGPSGFEEAVRKARGFGLLDEVEDAEEVMNLRKDRVLEGLTRVIELQIGCQEDLTRLVSEALRLDMGDAARAAESRWEDQVKNWVSELIQVAKTGSRARFVSLTRELRQRGRNDGVEAAKAALAERLVLTRERLAAAASRGNKKEVDNWVKEARELDLVGEVREARRVQAARVRSALEAFKTAVRGGCGSKTGIDTGEEQPGKAAGRGEKVSTAERVAVGLGVPAKLLAKLRVAIEREESVRSCRCAGGFGGVFERNTRGEPMSQDEVVGCDAAQGPQHDVILTALAVGSRGEHQFLANAPGGWEGLSGKGGTVNVSSDTRIGSGSGGLEDSPFMGAEKGVPVWPYQMDWGAIERLRLKWQRSVQIAPSIVGKAGSRVHRPEVAALDKQPMDADDSGEDEGEGDPSSDDKGHVAAQDGLRSRKSQAALAALDASATRSGSASSETGSVLTKSLLEAFAGGLGALTGLQTLDLALEGLRSLGPNGQLGKWCPQLTFVRLDVNRLTTLEGGLEGLARTLETLSVRDNQLTSLRGLEGLSALQVLRLDANLIKRVDFARKMGGADVTRADASRTGDVSKPAQFAWPSLTELGLSANRNVSVQGLGGVCGNLEVLELAGNGVRRLEGALQGLPRLRVLDVSRNQLRGRSLWSEMRHCPLLTSLVASSNKITELPSPSALPGSVLLRELWLNGNGIRRLDALSWLPNLQRLYLQDNAIEAVGPLWGCINLEVLDLSFNCISNPGDLRHLGCLRSLRSLQLNDNPVASPGSSYPSAVLSAVPWLRELDNEPVTDTLRENVLQSLSTGRSGLLTCLLAKLPSSGGSPRGERVISRSDEPGSVSEEVDLDRGVGSPAKIDPPERLKVLWERVLRAVELGGREGHFAGRSSAASSAGIRHQHFCAEWRARLARSTRESTAAVPQNARSEGSVPLERPESVTASEAGIPDDAFDGIGGHKDGLFFPPGNGKAPSSLLKQLCQCFREHVRFGTEDSKESEVAPVGQRNDWYFEQEQKRRVDFVTKVQALWRGRQARIRFALLAEQRNLHRKAAETAGAVRIQALWRGFRVRRMRERHVARDAAARTVQARWRGHFLRKKIERAMAAAKYVDEDDFDYGGEMDGLLIGFEGLSRPVTAVTGVGVGSGENLGSLPIVKKHGWVGPPESTEGSEPRGMISGRGRESSVPPEARGSPLLATLAPLVRTERSRNGKEGSGNELGSPVIAKAASLALQRTDYGEHSELGRSSEKLTSDSHRLESPGLAAFERSPLQPIHTSPPAHNKLSGNAPSSSIVPLPAFSPPRSSDSFSHSENARESRYSLPDIRLGSSQAEPAWRNSKRFSEPGGRSLGDLEDLNEMTPRQLGEESSVRGSIQSTPRGPHVPRSQRKLEKQRQSISEIATEWGFKDEGTAAAALRSRDRLLRNGQLERRQKTLQDPEKRLQMFKAQAKHGPRLGPRPSLPKARPAWAKASEHSEDDFSSDG